MQEERNVRYGVVNVVDRAKFEKIWQVPFGYTYMSFDKGEAIDICRKKKNNNWVVEKIFHTNDDTNRKVEIYRSGFKE